MDKNKFRDPSRESAILGTILKYGKNVYIDSSDILSNNDFTSRINRIIYTCFKNLADDPKIENYDVETIKMKANSLGFNDVFQDRKSQEYLENLESVSFDPNNINLFSVHIKKLSHLRELRAKYSSALEYIDNTDVSEQLSEILRNCEEKITDFTNGIDNGLIESINDEIENHIKQLLEQEPVQMVGMSTGYNKLDTAIGGGLRKASLNIIASRTGVGKTFFGLNIARNVAKRGIPILFLDTEMEKSAILNRIIAIDSQVAYKKIETGQFKLYKELKDAVINSGQEIQNTSFHYKSISGMNHVESLAYARRWISKCVGYNHLGKANDALIIWDYIKVCGSIKPESHNPEWMILGAMATSITDFAIRYGIQILANVQVSREGINEEHEGVIAGSDIILRVASTLSMLKNKTQTDADLSDGYEYGNRKLINLKSRFGSSINVQGDYLNFFSSLKPNVSDDEGCGLFTEGHYHSDIVGGIC